MRRDRDDHSRDRSREGNGELHNNNDQGPYRPGQEKFNDRGMPEVVDTFSPPPRPDTGDSDGSNERGS